MTNKYLLFLLLCGIMCLVNINCASLRNIQEEDIDHLYNLAVKLIDAYSGVEERLDNKTEEAEKVQVIIEDLSVEEEAMDALICAIEDELNSTDIPPEIRVLILTAIKEKNAEGLKEAIIKILDLMEEIAEQEDKIIETEKKIDDIILAQ